MSTNKADAELLRAYRDGRQHELTEDERERLHMLPQFKSERIASLRSTGKPKRGRANIVTPIALREFLATEPTPPTWIVRDFIAHGMKGDLCGSSKTFKTFAALQLGLCVAGGIDYLGAFKINEPHGVAYFNLELFAWNFWERAKAQASALGIADECFDNFLVYNLRGNETTLRSQTQGYVDQLLASGTELVIVDPRYKLMQGDESENTGEGLREVLALRDRLAEHFATLFVTHDGKGDTSAKKSTDRGAGSYTAGADFDFRLTIDRAEGWDKSNLVYVIDSEGRARPTPPAFGVRFDGDLQTFKADETVMPIKFGTKVTATTDPRIKAERERAKQDGYKTAALDVVNGAGDNLLDLDTFDLAVNAKQGAQGVGVNSRRKLRKSLVAQKVLSTCREKCRDENGGVRNVKNGKTYISTPERIERYLASFDNLAV